MTTVRAVDIPIIFTRRVGNDDDSDYGKYDDTNNDTIDDNKIR